MVSTQLDILYDEDMEAHCQELAEKAREFLNQCGTDPMEIYRIEKFNPVRQPREEEGKFFDGDSYVIVKHNEKVYDIHYWHGKDATADEKGSAAALTVLISGALSPKFSRHHLEEMEYETDLFLSYFKQGIFYKQGGIESGFKKVEANVHEPVLYLVKGKRYPRAFPKPLSSDSLNDGDCFLLDMGDKLYIWHGSQASSQEKYKTSELANLIKDGERSGTAKRLYPQEAGGEVEDEFWAILGGKPDKINPPIPDEAPAGTEEDFMKYSLYHISDDTGSVQMNEVTQRPLKRELMNDSDTYILELFNQVYVWQGKDASKQEKLMAVEYGKKIVAQHNKPKGTHISRVPQGCEDATFKSFFEGFEPKVTVDFGKDAGLDSSTTANQDIGAVASKQMRAKQLAFDKLGKNWTKTVYYLQDFKTPVEISDPREQGKFFAESTYIVDIKGESHRYVIEWQGPKLSIEQMAGLKEAKGVILEGLYTSDQTFITIRKGHEDTTFLSFFPDGFLILDEQRISMDDWYAKTAERGVMFRVQGQFDGTARAIEQNDRATQYLNSGDAFVVINPNFESGFAWYGRGCNEEEIKSCDTVIDAVKRPAALATMKEGEESEEFWASIGGKGEYCTAKDMEIPHDFETRLFQISNTSGYMWMSEVPAFGQEDLSNYDCFILDAYTTIYVWHGALANRFEVKGAETRAKKYLDEVKDGRKKEEVNIEMVKAGREPPAFQVQFIQWEPEVAQVWIDEDPEEIAKKSSAAEEQKQAEKIAKGPFDGYLDPNENKFTYDVLKTSFPKGVKFDAKEAYLNADEFKTVFGMTFEEFSKLSKPRKTMLKRDKQLY